MSEQKEYKKLLFFITGVFFFACAIGIGVSTVYARNSSGKIAVPSKTDILKEGYPKNEKGLTYGPHIEDIREPDLILVEKDDGMIGYVKQTDLVGTVPQNPKEACELNQRKSYSIPIYLQDGETIVGEFLIETGEVSQ